MILLGTGSDLLVSRAMVHRWRLTSGRLGLEVVSFLLLVVDTSVIVVLTASLVERARLIRLKMGVDTVFDFDFLGDVFVLSRFVVGEASWILWKLEHT